MEQAYEFVRENHKLVAWRQKLYYVSEGGNTEFRLGESVWRYYPQWLGINLGSLGRIPLS